MNDKAEDVAEIMDDGNLECDDGTGIDTGTVSPTPATVPKKRGRPGNSDKPKKIPSGRGRGRPAKGAADKKPAKVSDGTEDEGTASDGDSPLPNGDDSSKVPSKRGRHPKRKRKLEHTIEATGKGRGRPKKASKVEAGDDENDASDDNDDGASTGYKPVKKANTKTSKKGRGRPKKVQDSDDESSDDKLDDEIVRRPVGRPATGAVKLNIVRTGKKQGRPKQNVTATHESNGEKLNKKIGRPLKTGKGSYIPTGKPRGRPKSQVHNSDVENAVQNPIVDEKRDRTNGIESLNNAVQFL